MKPRSKKIDAIRSIIQIISSLVRYKTKTTTKDDLIERYDNKGCVIVANDTGKRKEYTINVQAISIGRVRLNHGFRKLYSFYDMHHHSFKNSVGCFSHLDEKKFQTFSQN